MQPVSACRACLLSFLLRVDTVRAHTPLSENEEAPVFIRGTITVHVFVIMCSADSW